MELFLLAVVLPFFFSLVFVFIVFLRSAFPVYVPCILALCVLASVIASSIFQVYLSSIKCVGILQGIPFIFFNSFIYSAFVEELFKMVCFYISFINIPFLCNYKKNICKECYSSIAFSDKSEFEKIFVVDTLLLAMFFCATFAGFENVAYFVYEPNITYKRIFGASLLHITLSPFYVELFLKRKLFSSIILSVFFHGCYNLFILLNKTFISSFIVVFLLVYNVIYMYKHKLR